MSDTPPAMVRHHALLAVFLMLLIWGAHFWHVGGFGLYDDDYGQVSPAFDMSTREVAREAGRLVVSGNQGRPFHRSLILALSFLGARAGGLRAIHVIGFVIITTNALLFLWLLRRVTRDEVVVVTGTLAFALFPADTTRAFATHSLGVQPSLLFLLMALHLYLSRWRFLGYAAALCSLCCYETFFPVFLAAHLLHARSWRAIRTDLVRHGLVMLGMVTLAAGLRALTGEARIAGLGPQAFVRGGSNLVLGPLVSLGLFVYRPLEAFHGASALALDWTVVGASLALLAAIFLELRPAGGERALERVALVDSRLVRLELPAGLRVLASLATTGAVMLVLAYPLTFTAPAIAVAGRATRVHAAAAVGAGILVGCLSAGILVVATALGRRRVTATLLAAAFAALVASGLRVQADYVASWSQQRSFWRQVVTLCPNLEDRTVILADVGGLPGARPTGEYDVNLVFPAHPLGVGLTGERGP